MPPKGNEVVKTTDQKEIKLKNIQLTTTVEDLLASEVLPPGVNSKEKILAITQYGKELGMDPMTAINNIAVIKGKMVISSSMLGALLKKHGYEYIWSANWLKENPGTKDELIYSEVEIYWVSKTLKRELSQKFRVTWQELALAGLTGNPTYEKYPKFMLRARTLSAAVRAIAPEILLGIYTMEEMIDQDKNLSLDVTEEGEATIIDTTKNK